MKNERCSMIRSTGVREPIHLLIADTTNSCSWTPYRICSIASGLLLLCAFALKVISSWENIWLTFGWMIPVGIQLLGLVWEFVLGVALSFGLLRRASRWLGIITFSAYSLISMWHVIMGHSDCGCFGVVTVHPALTLGMNVGIVVCLSSLRPTSSPTAGHHIWRSRAEAILIACSTTGLAAACAIALHDMVSEEPQVPIAILGADTIDFGKTPPGAQKFASFTVVNSSRRSTIEIGDAIKSCSCSVVSLPKRTLGPGESMLVEVAVTASQRPGPFSSQVLLVSRTSGSILPDLVPLIVVMTVTDDVDP